MSKFVYFSLLPFISKIVADTPADCRYEDIKGQWTFHVSERNFDNTLDCPNMEQTPENFPNTVVINLHDYNQANQDGTFTLIYNQGYEILLNSDKWFSFFEYSANFRDETKPFGVSYSCLRTLNGWVHTDSGENWGCFYGVKNQENSVARPDFMPHPVEELQPESLKNLMKRRSIPVDFPVLKTKRSVPRDKKSNFELLQSLKKSIAQIQEEDLSSVATPKNFDWNDFGMVSPVKNQGSCGSCYAFASTGMFEARARVQTDNQWQPLFSEQEIVSCSDYSQGCAGGFPYLISKYGQDFGLVEEHCYEYTSGSTRVTGECLPINTTLLGCDKKWGVSDYGYVGGFYGAASERLIREEIFANGPIAVSIDAGDLHSYESGIFFPEAQYGSDALKWDPFEFTSHVVLITGWGWEGNIPFWNIKNSWGESWGEHGYFRLVRGADSIAVESLPAKCTMIPPENLWTRK